MLHWILERDAFADGDASLAQAVLDAGQQVVWWNDEWWTDRAWPFPDGERALFHGSLRNAHRIRAEGPWTPGAFCATERFCCQVWYEAARRWLVHRSWVVCSASHLVASPGPLLDEIGAGDEVFVRPDSPLKPFSGRVVGRKDLSLAALDHGFYYDDPTLPVVLTPVAEIGSEWRVVVVNRCPVSACGYDPATRAGTHEECEVEVMSFAASVAAELPPPEHVYVMDVCKTPAGLRLLELNPFSGADLYTCDRRQIVDALQAADVCRDECTVADWGSWGDRWRGPAGMPKVSARLVLRRASEGGREAPVSSGYRPSHNFLGADNRMFHLGRIDFEKPEVLQPGEGARVRISFVDAPGLRDHLRVGRRWRIQEGSRLIGWAEAEELVYVG